MSVPVIACLAVIGILALAAILRPKRSSPDLLHFRHMVKNGGDIEMYSSSGPEGSHRVVIKNGVVEECRKNGEDLDPESDEGKALVAACRADHKASMDKLDEDMEKMKRDMDEWSREFKADMDRRFRR